MEPALRPQSIGFATLFLGRHDAIVDLKVWSCSMTSAWASSIDSGPKWVVWDYVLGILGSGVLVSSLAMLGNNSVPVIHSSYSWRKKEGQ